jgi:hypothetical protein
MKQRTGRFIGIVSLLLLFLSAGATTAAQLSLEVSRAICALVSEAKNSRARGGRASFSRTAFAADRLFRFRLRGPMCGRSLTSLTFRNELFFG